jgi:hypothetical protein
MKLELCSFLFSKSFRYVDDVKVSERDIERSEEEEEEEEEG